MNGVPKYGKDYEFPLTVCPGCKAKLGISVSFTSVETIAKRRASHSASLDDVVPLHVVEEGKRRRYIQSGMECPMCRTVINFSFVWGGE